MKRERLRKIRKIYAAKKQIAANCMTSHRIYDESVQLRHFKIQRNIYVLIKKIWNQPFQYWNIVYSDGVFDCQFILYLKTVVAVARLII